MLQLCCHPTLFSSNADLHHGGGTLTGGTLTEGTQELGSVVVPKQHLIQGTGRGHFQLVLAGHQGPHPQNVCGQLQIGTCPLPLQ